VYRLDVRHLRKSYETYSQELEEVHHNKQEAIWKPPDTPEYGHSWGYYMFGGKLDFICVGWALITETSKDFVNLRKLHLIYYSNGEHLSKLGNRADNMEKDMWSQVRLDYNDDKPFILVNLQWIADWFKKEHWAGYTPF
jgi:hypothetical protein